MTRKNFSGKTARWLLSPQEENENYFDIRRYLIPTVLCFLCGIYFILSKLPWFLLLLPVCIASAISIAAVGYGIWQRRNGKPFGCKGVLLPLFLLLCFLLGGWRAWYAENIQCGELKALAGGSAWIYGTVETEPKLTSSEKRIGFKLKVCEVEDNQGNRQEIQNGYIQLYLTGTDPGTVWRGEYVCGFVELTPPSGPQYEGGFNYEMYLRQNNIVLAGFTDHLEQIENPPARSLTQKISDWGLWVNHSIAGSVSRHFSDTPEGEALLTGIMLGDKTGFSDELYEDFSKSGFMHVAAVSGLHVSFLFMAVSFLLGRLRIPKGIINFIMIPILLCFAAVVSFTPSVCRAVIMMILFLLSYNFQRDPDQMVALFAAAGILLIFNPYQLFNVGFQLSFGATLGIQLFAKPLEQRLWLLRKIPMGRTLASSLSVSFAAFLGTAFVLADTFNQVSFAGIFANIWVIPCVTVLRFCSGDAGTEFLGTGIFMLPASSVSASFLFLPCFGI